MKHHRQYRNALAFWLSLVAAVFGDMTGASDVPELSSQNLAADISSGTSTDNANRLLAQLDEKAGAVLAEFSVAGATVALIENGEVLTPLAFGYFDVEAGEPLLAATVMQAGSISKPVAAFGVVKLVQDGAIDLDAPVSEYLSRWQIPTSEFDEEGVTVRRLLSHTAGLSLGGYPGFDPGVERPSIEKSLSGETNGSGDVRLVHAPGDGFRYSGGGYTLLQLIVEEVSGQSFATYMQESVLKPLGMQSSSYAPTEEMIALTARAHDPSGSTIPGMRFTAQAAAGLFTTAADLGRFVVANFPNARDTGSRQPLGSTAVAKMHERVATQQAQDPTGLGFFLLDDGIVGHGGSNIGWKAAMWFRPAEKDGIVMLTNSENGAELTDAVLCWWADQKSITAFDDRCAARAEMNETGRNLFVTIIFIAAFVWMSIALNLVLKRRRLITRSVPRRTMAGALGLIVIALICLLWTNAGALLVAGFNPPIATIHFLPPAYVQSAVPGLVLILGLAVALLTDKSSDE